MQRLVRDWAKDNGGEFYQGIWIQYADANGIGYAQPDAFVVLKAEILLFEAKLTQSDQAQDQCEKLYKPLLEDLFDKPCRCCQVFKNIRYLSADMINCVEQLKGKKEYQLWHNPMI